MVRLGLDTTSSYDPSGAGSRLDLNHFRNFVMPLSAICVSVVSGGDCDSSADT
jgi:hypothetical protein